MPSSLLTTAAVFVLLLVCAGLWYGARATSRGRSAPAWTRALDKYPRVAVGVLAISVLALVGLAVAAALGLILG